MKNVATLIIIVVAAHAAVAQTPIPGPAHKEPTPIRNKSKQKSSEPKSADEPSLKIGSISAKAQSQLVSGKSHLVTAKSARGLAKLPALTVRVKQLTGATLRQHLVIEARNCDQNSSYLVVVYSTPSPSNPFSRDPSYIFDNYGFPHGIGVLNTDETGHGIQAFRLECDSRKGAPGDRFSVSLHQIDNGNASDDSTAQASTSDPFCTRGEAVPIEPPKPMTIGHPR